MAFIKNTTFLPNLCSSEKGLAALRKSSSTNATVHSDRSITLAFRMLRIFLLLVQAVHVQAVHAIGVSTLQTTYQKGGLEFHSGHAASFQTDLAHRQCANRIYQRHQDAIENSHFSFQVESSGSTRQLDPDGAGTFQLTTPLEDMSSEYTGIVGVGTNVSGGPQFEARVVFDTGSTNLWVASVLCQTAPCDPNGAWRYYDPNKSKTQAPYDGQDPDAEIDIVFGTGELKGPLRIDTYRVGPMAVDGQAFAMIHEMTGDVFSSFPFEGILGLAFPSLSFGSIEPFFERVIKKRLLKSNEFAFFLNTDSTEPSALLWGGVDQDLFEGPIVMFPVVKPHYWALELVDFKIGNVSLTESSSGKAHVQEENKAKYLLVDSGTTYFTAPSEMYQQIIRQFPEDKCSNVGNYPDIQYILKSAYDQTFTLEVSQETYMVMDENDMCRPAFMKLDIKRKAYGPAMILGEVFMRHFFTVFSRGDGAVNKAKVGFARAKIGALPKIEGAKSPDNAGSTRANASSGSRVTEGDMGSSLLEEYSQASPKPRFRLASRKQLIRKR